MGFVDRSTEDPYGTGQSMMVYNNCQHRITNSDIGTEDITVITGRMESTNS